MSKINDLIKDRLNDIENMMNANLSCRNIAMELNVSSETARKLIISINPDYFCSRYKKLTKSDIEIINNAVKNNIPIATIAKKLNVARATAYNKIKILYPDYKGNQGGKGFKDTSRKSVIELLKSNTASNTIIRKRLIEDGYKQERCECCGLSEWMGKPIPLELHHKDFNHWNNDLDNLEILCSNCHMQKHNYNNKLK